MNFDICNEKTWDLASGKPFLWKGNDFFNLDNVNERYSEIDFVNFIGQMLNIIEKETSIEKINNFGRNKIIYLIVDQIAEKKYSTLDICHIITNYLNSGKSDSVIFKQILLVQENKDINNINIFNICDETTWRLASDNQFIWQNIPLFSISSNNIITEKHIVNILLNIFDLLNKLISVNKMEIYGKEKLIVFIIDELLKASNEDEIVEKIYLIIEQGFDINIIDSLYPTLKGKMKKDEIKKTNKIKNDKQIINSDPPEIQKREINDDSKPGVFLCLSIIAFFVCIFLFIKTFFESMHSSTYNLFEFYKPYILPMFILIIACLLVAKYLKEKNKRSYYKVCKSMEYFLGQKSDELIIAWGTPSKTTKLPSDKSISILEYKDSIRNYNSYSTKRYSKGFSYGYSTGRSTITKYNKTFYVKDGFIIDYKYSIT